ncbi:MAG TPA: ATP synthase F1 subunit epsilon [bacterium]|nr:ATP synthase F1 subunit epsilon [bacterium]HPS29884.1 ATP synthase F1 subunit epsilon [bacterium]
MLKVKLLTRTTVLFEGEAVSVRLPARKGEMEILDMHIPIITVLTTGVICLKFADSVQYYSVSKGVASLVNNELTILSDASESADSISLERALKAKKRAEERLQSSTAGSYEFRRAVYSLKRAENRIKLVEKITNR